MLFAELEEQESMAQRVLLYPREWDELENEDVVDGRGKKKKKRKERERNVETSLRLLRIAAKRYHTILQPIDPIPQTTGNTPLTPEEKYPLTALLHLLPYNRIIYLPPSGLLLSATPLDLLYTLPMTTWGLGLSTSATTSQPSIILLEPSQDTLSSLPEGALPDSEFLQRVTLEAAPTDPGLQTRLLAETSWALEEELSAGDFVDTTAYVRLDHPEFDGPIPEGVGKGRRVWEVVYERFWEKRMEVCGLDREMGG